MDYVIAHRPSLNSIIQRKKRSTNIYVLNKLLWISAKMFNFRHINRIMYFITMFYTQAKNHVFIFRFRLPDEFWNRNVQFREVSRVILQPLYQQISYTSDLLAIYRLAFKFRKCLAHSENSCLGSLLFQSIIRLF